MRRRKSLSKQIGRTLLLLLLLAGLVFGAYQLLLYQQSRDRFPVAMTIAGLEVDGLTPEEAAELLQTHYLSPVAVYHNEERIEITPQDVGFNLEVETMLSQAEQAVSEQSYAVGFLYYLTGWAWKPIRVPLQAGYDPVLLREMLVTIAGFLDQPARPPQILSENAIFEQGQGGYVTDIEASLPLVEQALYQPEERMVSLVIIEEEAPVLNFELLERVIESKLTNFEGVGSIFVMDLETGEEISINADVAISGLSILKIGIFIEAWRHLELPLNDYEQQLFFETAVHSSNYSANLLLNIAAGEPNTYKGTDVLTETFWRLGLENSFMTVPYDADPVAYRTNTYQTPANSQANTEISSFYLDPNRQTTAEDMGSLLAMLYQCSQGGGALLAVYEGEIVPEECQYTIDLMVQNEEGNLIRFGVPDDVPVSHKHGWIEMTHGDAGIVFSPGGDYVLVEYLHQNSDWLQADISFPILREVSRAVYNYFNFDDPYMGDALFEEERFDEEAGAEDTGAEDTGEAEDTTTDDTAAGGVNVESGEVLPAAESTPETGVEATETITDTVE